MKRVVVDSSPSPSNTHYGRTKAGRSLSDRGATAASKRQGWECPRRAQCPLPPLTGRRPEPREPQRPAQGQRKIVGGPRDSINNDEASPEDVSYLLH